MPTNIPGINGPRFLRAAVHVTVFERMRLRWVSQGQVCTTARRDTKCIMLQSLRVELAVAVFGPGMSPTGNNSASWSVWVCMLGQRREDSCSVGVRTQPHIAPAFTVWPHSGGKLYLCVQWGTQWGTCWLALCMSVCPRVRFCVCSALGIPPTFHSVWTLDALSCPGVTPQEFDPQNAGRNLIASFAPAVCVSITVKRQWWSG